MTTLYERTGTEPGKNFQEENSSFFCDINVCGFKSIRPRDLGVGHKVPGFNLRALNCCLTLKLCICFQKYKLTSHEKKIGLNLKKSVRF